jgi:ribonuclease HI
MLAARYITRLGCLSLEATEAYAALLAIQQCKSLGFLNVHFEGDTKAIVDAVNCGGNNQSRVGHMVEDFQVQARSLSNWKMTFVKREGNNVAHLLAKHAKTYALNILWFIPPECIRESVLLEQFALAF